MAFIPYITTYFSKEYIIPNYIGETMAAVLPSVLSLIQGVSQDPGCHNVTKPGTNITVLEPKKIIPNYPVSIYFLMIFFLICLSTVSFGLLHFTKVARNARRPVLYLS